MRQYLDVKSRYPDAIVLFRLGDFYEMFYDDAVYAARVLNEVVDRAVQVHGALGLTDRTPLAAMLAAARAGRIYDGPDEVHRMVVSRRILKEFATGEGWRFS